MIDLKDVEIQIKNNEILVTLCQELRKLKETLSEVGTLIRDRQYGNAENEIDKTLTEFLKKVKL